MGIGVTDIFVDDQETVRVFYAGVRGFQVRMDAPDPAHWLTVVSPEETDGTQLQAEARRMRRRSVGVLPPNTPTTSLTPSLTLNEWRPTCGS